MRLFFIFLRRPNELDDRRSDPFWEFGSFGITGCHRNNLLNPKSRHIKIGDRLAFLQGGNGEIRVVGVTPKISEITLRQRITHQKEELLEVRWDSVYRPLSYGEAPLLVSNQDFRGCFPAVNLMLANVQRSSLVAKAASKFRTRTQPLPDQLSKEIYTWFDRPGLPKVERYIDSIAPNNTGWYRNADANQWWHHAERVQKYFDCIGVWPEDFIQEYGKVSLEVHSPCVQNKNSTCRR